MRQVLVGDVEDCFGLEADVTHTRYEACSYPESRDQREPGTSALCHEQTSHL
jgi:hypothetical protein